jgi:hypothetical protein
MDATAHGNFASVSADDKKNARLIVSQIVVETLEDFDMSYPTVTAERAGELQAIRAELTKQALPA